MPYTPRARPAHALRLSAAFGAVVSVVALLAGCTAAPDSVPPTVSCAVTATADLVPHAGVLFGVNLDWGAETLAEFSGSGLRPAVAVSFSGLPMSADDRANVGAAAGQVLSNGGELLLTLEPRAGLAAITPAVADDLGALLGALNNRGVPVVVRFAHEMNGSWYEWGQQPTEYVAAFRRVADAVKRDAPGSAMMWAPNYGGGYPFAGGAYAATPGTADFTALDTDGDGTLTIRDDPYLPYYPGDDVVDWVGMSLYHWGSAYPWGEDELPEPGKFAAQLTGTYVGLAGDETATPDFYGVYGDGHGKPVAIPETAALVVSGGDPALELAIKQAWWRQVFSADTATRFPRLHMINWFEWEKYETEIGARVDWTLARSTAVRAAFLRDLPDWLIFGHPDESCAQKAG
ncbi:glycoside hydrolase family 26 protein [Cryobacterium algoricola]|uniref:glycoside hydrolase family 26 protein n=1 Tax=Cryobacterium algoricola TaxID=1259183 RepID=UPI001F540DAC|nr:glycosyl hydrolase [Cryobacterium algoricola]